MIWTDDIFIERQVFSVFKLRGSHHQKIPRQDFCISVWNNALCTTNNHDDQQSGRKRGIFYQTVRQTVTFFYGNLYETYVCGFLIVIKSPFHISVEIDHLQFFGYPGKKGSLYSNRHQDNTEDQVKNIVFHWYIIKHYQNGKHNGSNTSKSGPGGDANLPKR